MRFVYLSADCGRTNKEEEDEEKKSLLVLYRAAIMHSLPFVFFFVLFWHFRSCGCRRNATNPTARVWWCSVETISIMMAVVATTDRCGTEPRTGPSAEWWEGLFLFFLFPLSVLSSCGHRLVVLLFEWWMASRWVFSLFLLFRGFCYMIFSFGTKPICVHKAPFFSLCSINK